MPIYIADAVYVLINTNGTMYAIAAHKNTSNMKGDTRNYKTKRGATVCAAHCSSDLTNFQEDILDSLRNRRLLSETVQRRSHQPLLSYRDQGLLYFPVEASHQ